MTEPKEPHEKRCDHKFLCEDGGCLGEMTLSMTDKQYQSRFYFSKKAVCPICAGPMYEVTSHSSTGQHPQEPAIDYEHCGNMSSDGEHDCNYRGGRCKFIHTKNCGDYKKCTCEYCTGVVHDAAIAQAAREEGAKEVLDKLVGWFEPIRDHARNDEKHFDEQGTDYLYDRGKCAGVALFIEFEVRKKIQSLRTP